MNYNEIPLNTTVSVRVKGQSKRLTPVRLVAAADRPDTVRVLNGKRGRPPFLHADRITEVRVLKSV
jgi:hypothetical protein